MLTVVMWWKDGVDGRGANVLLTLRAPESCRCVASALQQPVVVGTPVCVDLDNGFALADNNQTAGRILLTHLHHHHSSFVGCYIAGVAHVRRQSRGRGPRLLHSMDAPHATIQDGVYRGKSEWGGVSGLLICWCSPFKLRPSTSITDGSSISFLSWSRPSAAAAVRLVRSHILLTSCFVQTNSR